MVLYGKPPSCNSVEYLMIKYKCLIPKTSMHRLLQLRECRVISSQYTPGPFLCILIFVALPSLAADPEVKLASETLHGVIDLEIKSGRMRERPCNIMGLFYSKWLKSLIIVIPPPPPPPPPPPFPQLYSVKANRITGVLHLSTSLEYL